MSGAEQIRWQRRAHEVLGRLLERGAADCLPVIEWTIAASSAVGRAPAGALTRTRS
jgi:hypothetical protein